MVWLWILATSRHQWLACVNQIVGLEAPFLHQQSSVSGLSSMNSGHVIDKELLESYMYSIETANWGIKMRLEEEWISRVI